jgi:hypothetical protein
VDHVFPDVPVRQWVLSLPHRVRYALAWDHELCKQVVGALLREVARHLHGRARADGLVDPRGGGVAGAPHPTTSHVPASATRTA